MFTLKMKIDMKKSTILSAALACVLSLTGCYDLERYPSDQLSSGTFWKTQDQADMAMMGVYNTMQYEHVFGLQFALDGLGGIAMGYDNPSYQTFQRGNYDVTSSYILYKWQYLYEGIARANVVLQNIDKTEISDELKAQYRGEARFMRGLFYFTLMDFFGGVPIYDESTVVGDSYSDMKKARSTADEVRSFILADLDAAIASLPEAWAQASYGRATKYAAIALKGKVYLYNKQYSEAKTEFLKIKESEKFELYPNYADLFLPAGDESSEMIFAVQNVGGVGTDVGMPMCFYMGTRASYGSCWNNVMASTSFVDTYEYTDGKEFNWEDEFPGYTTSDDKKKEVFNSTFNGAKLVSYTPYRDQLQNLYDRRDPRMKASIILPYTHYTGWYKNANSEYEYALPTLGRVDGEGFIRVNSAYNCYLWRKFVPEGNMDGLINNRADTPINFPLIRYADVLLMLAECENELGNLDDAVAYINEVRQRPSVNMPKINSGPEWLEARTKDAVFKRIRHERAVELAAEGHSFSDLKRWRLLEELNGRAEKEITGVTRYTRSVSSRDYLWPIPSTEIEKNPALEQNPNW